MRAALSLAALLLTVSTVPAGAQQAPETLPEEEAEEEVEPIRRYTVELIIFAYGESISPGTEVFLPDEPEEQAIYDTASGSYFDKRGEELTEVEAPTVARRYMDLELVLTAEDDFTMNGIYNKLVELEAYEPLFRAGWTQPTYEKALTASIALDTLAESPPWLDGQLTLYLGRYLHLVVDLTMNSDRTMLPQADDALQSKQTFGDARVRPEYELIDEYGELLPPPVSYRIFEDRIMKSGDIRYFDHPKFGVVAKITRFEEPEEDEIMDDTDDLLPGSQLSP